MTVTQESPVPGKRTFLVPVHLRPEDADKLHADLNDENVSEFVNELVSSHFRQKAAAAYLEEYEAEHGPFSDEAIAEAEEMWRQAEERYEQWLAENNE